MTIKVDTREIIKLFNEYGSIKAVADKLRADGIDISDRTIYNRVNNYYTNEPTSSKDPHGMNGVITAPDKLRTEIKDGTTKFVFTTAQNNTPVHKSFLDALHVFCDVNKAQLIVSTITYNKKGFQNKTKDDAEWYDPLIVPYINNQSIRIADGLVFCGELNILPTAVTPLTGFENYTQESSGIIPHTKVQMLSLPRMKQADPRFLYTTGAVTQRNYIEKKAGQKASFHHVFGALFVEVDSTGNWFARQLIAKEDGVFQDLTTVYSPEGTAIDNSVEAITWGDIHTEKMDKGVFEGAWGDTDSMLSVLKPKYQFIHDLTDFSARNHHNIDNPFFLAETYFNNRGNVRKDLERSGAFLQYITRTGSQAVVVDSNHDQALERWLREANIKTDPENAEFYHRANAEIYHHIAMKQPFHVYKWAVTMQGQLKSNSIFLREDDSVMLHNIEHGLHGHRGPNGSRGNIRGFKTIGRKVNIGHSHSAGILDGVYVSGVSATLDMDYNKGPTTWSHSHIVTYKTGKRAIITMRGNKWKA